MGRNSMSIEAYKEKIKELFNENIIILEDNFISRKTKMKTKCNVCGYIWETTPDTLLRAKYGCPKCAKKKQLLNINKGLSKGELEIQKILDENNISYIQQFCFYNLKSINNHLLFFDFAIIYEDELLGLIEFDGKQHYERINLYTEKQFRDLQENDKIKNNFCEINNIPLIRIPYTKLGKITLKDLIFN